MRRLEKCGFSEKVPIRPGNLLDSSPLPLFAIVLFEKNIGKCRALFPRFTIVLFTENNGKWRALFPRFTIAMFEKSNGKWRAHWVGCLGTNPVVVEHSVCHEGKSEGWDEADG